MKTMQLHPHASNSPSKNVSQPLPRMNVQISIPYEFLGEYNLINY